MLDLGWTELLVIGILTILIFGPKELPVVFRTVTQWLGKARSVAREFQRTVDDMARETELDEIRKAAKNAASDMNTMVDPTGSMEGLFDDPDTQKSKSKSQPQSMPHTPRPETVRNPSDGNDGPAASQAPAAPASAPAPAEPESGSTTPEQNKGGQA
ncbi:MAG: Sec-independent protein translocase protein TatB [Minwuia sp.]|nr:Sec-independent protein translocase protein TatB [Minwuia sp.]